VIRRAACPCGALAIACDGDPVRVSVCHRLDCQRRSGAPFTDPDFPPPAFSVYEPRRHAWVAITGEGVVHDR
jgi:hypothetical protein